MFGFVETEKTTNMLNTIESCEKQIKETSNALYILAASQLILISLIGFFTSNLLASITIILPDTIFILLLGFLYQKHKSRTIAIIILIYSIVISYITFANKLGIEQGISTTGGKNIFLALFFLYISYKSVKASFCYSKFKNYSIRWKHWFIKTFVYLITFAFWFFILMILCVIFPNMSDSLSGGLVFTVLFLPMYLIYSGWFPWGSKLKIKYIKNAENVK